MSQPQPDAAGETDSASAGVTSPLADEARLKQDRLLAAHRQAQQSAEHHDRIVWQITTIMLAGQVALGGLLARAWDLKPPGWLAGLGIPVVGVLATITTFVFVKRTANVKVHRYGQCKVLEQEIGIEVHRNTPYQKIWGWYLAVQGAALICWLVTAVLWIAGH